MTYLSRIGVRESTMRLALDILEERVGSIIVETGCARQADNWTGDGMSTLVLGQWASDHDAHLTTVDANPDNLAMARTLGSEFGSHIAYVHDDSVHYLADRTQPIDLLYLDSFDYPLMDLLEELELMEGDFHERIAAAQALGDDYLAETYDDIIGRSQVHCEREITAALPILHDRSIVLIDDANLPGGGKARRARKVLADNGWQCILDEYQTLWVKQ